MAPKGAGAYHRRMAAKRIWHRRWFQLSISGVGLAYVPLGADSGVIAPGIPI
jgi:hypothetical protein